MVDDTRRIVEEFVFYILRGGKMPPILYYLPPSPPCRCILLLGKMLDINFDLKVLNIMEGEHMKPDFVSMNPQHCIPTIKDETLILWESRAILSYLVAMYGKDDALYPADIKTRALVDSRVQFDLGTLYARFSDYFMPTIFMGAPLEESKKSKLNEALYWLECMLKGKTWLAAEHFTIADLTCGVTVSQIEAFEFDLRNYPKTRDWLQRFKDELEPYGYQEINQSGADVLAEMFKAKLLK
ncbi:hypothetical protein ACFFRR_005895 [Megaselia abdita]